MIFRQRFRLSKKRRCTGDEFALFNNNSKIKLSVFYFILFCECKSICFFVFFLFFSFFSSKFVLLKTSTVTENYYMCMLYWFSLLVVVFVICSCFHVLCLCAENS
jgi:hypothetical protein